MFIERLEIILKKRNIKGAELSRILNLSNATYTQWRKGKIPNGETLLKISNELNVSIDYLLGKDETAEEGEIISFYRKADDRGKDRIYKTAKDEADQAEQLLRQKENITEFSKEIKPFA